MKLPKVFIETSVFVRFLTKDNAKKYQDCYQLFKLISEGKLRPYTSNTVIMEIIFILDRHYHFPKMKIVSAVNKLLLLRNLTLVEKTDTKKALTFYKTHNIKYGDCLIAAQVPNGVLLVSYDDDFRKIKDLEIAAPDGIKL